MLGSTDWIRAYHGRGTGPLPTTECADYSLQDVSARHMLPQGDVPGMLLDAGLRDFAWQMVWSGEAPSTDDELADLITGADGYVIFMHGWTGTRAIWEDLPARVVTMNPRLVALVIDHNGFGATSFVSAMPNFNQCSPVAAMRAVEHWFDLLRLRRQNGDPRPKTINFVGHSMGAAALFFLTEARWKYAEQTRTAIAPALLLHDETHRTFYTTLGLSIGLAGRLQFLEGIENRVSPRILDILTDGASPDVIREHARIYEETPRSVTARTLAAMGVLTDHPMPHTWDLMNVVLGHKDVLVGLIPMLNLLDELTFDVEQVRVVMGTHYLFSVGEEMKRVHTQNRNLVLHDILALHEQALVRQQKG